MKKSILYTSLGGFIVITFLIKIILSFQDIMMDMVHHLRLMNKL